MSEKGRPKPEAPSDAKPAYCRECGAPAGLHNAGRAARRPSAEPKTVAEFLGPQLNAELERAEAVNRADEAERRAEKAEAKLATLKAGGAVGYVDAGKE